LTVSGCGAGGISLLGRELGTGHRDGYGLVSQHRLRRFATSSDGLHKVAPRENQAFALRSTGERASRRPFRRHRLLVEVSKTPGGQAHRAADGRARRPVSRLGRDQRRARRCADPWSRLHG
jgi:hypothetical protein